MAVLELLYWRKRGRGKFIVTVNRDGGLVSRIILPDGRVYTTTLRPNHTFDQDWNLGFVTSTDPTSSSL